MSSGEEEEEIELFESDQDEENDLVEKEWGLSWDASELEETTDIYDNCVNPVESSTTHTEEDKIRSSSTPVERMALNDHKAGMEGLDKEKINRIIYEASKGSKFYQNEKKKEQKTKERIEELKKEMTKYTASDRQRALHESDKVLKSLHEKIDLTRTLVHIDMDAFYAAVEMRDNPRLKDLPMAVGGNDMLSTSNYLARRFGVRAAMPGFIAKKLCPQLVIVPCHFDKYRSVSNDVRDIFRQYDPNFAPMSLDEAYLDLTEYMAENFFKYESQLQRNEITKELSEIIVEEIRQKIFEKTTLTASAGIAPNMMLSKICSDMNKPNGQYFLKPDQKTITDFICNLPIRKVFGIGKVSEQMLKALDITSCKHLLDKRGILFLLFSDTSFHYFMRVALGISTNHITHDDRKSMSAERTFSDVSDKETLLKICHDLCIHLASDLQKEDLQGRNITLKYKLSSFVTKTRSKTLAYPISTASEIYTFAKELLLHEIKSYPPSKFELRLMGIRVCHFVGKTTHKQDTVEKFFKNLPGTSTSVDEIKPGTHDDITQPEIIDNTNNDDSTHKNDELVQCPVCGTRLKNDLATLNTHIDNCLTKQTIKEVVKEENKKAGSTVKNVAQTKETSKKRKSVESLENVDKKVTLLSFWKKS